MSDETKVPTKAQLARLSDAELLDCVRLSLQQLAECARRNENMNETVRAYIAYQAECYRRGLLSEFDHG